MLTPKIMVDISDRSFFYQIIIMYEIIDEKQATPGGWAQINRFKCSKRPDGVNETNAALAGLNYLLASFLHFKFAVDSCCKNYLRSPLNYAAAQNGLLYSNIRSIGSLY